MILVLATQNKDKVKEFKKLIADNNLDIAVKSLQDYNITVDVIENGSTLKEMPILKLKVIKI